MSILSHDSPEGGQIGFSTQCSGPRNHYSAVMPTIYKSLVIKKNPKKKSRFEGAIVMEPPLPQFLLIELKAGSEYTKFKIMKCNLSECNCNTTYSCGNCKTRPAEYNTFKNAVCRLCLEKIGSQHDYGEEYKKYKRIYRKKGIKNIKSSLKKIVTSLERGEYDSEKMLNIAHDGVVSTNILTNSSVKYLLRRHCCHLVKPLQAVKIKLNFPIDQE
jgi:hypothetical protein